MRSECLLLDYNYSLELAEELNKARNEADGQQLLLGVGIYKDQCVHGVMRIRHIRNREPACEGGLATGTML